MHHTRRIAALLLIVLLLGTLAACGDDDSDSTPEETSVTAEPTPAPLDNADPAARAALQRQYEELSTAHSAISAVWEALATGEQAQCGTYPTYPLPEDIRVDDANLSELAEVLRTAAIDVDHAVSLWRAECQNPRPTTPPDVIDEGRLAARTANDTLRTAEMLLNGE